MRVDLSGVTGTGQERFSLTGIVGGPASCIACQEGESSSITQVLVTVRVTVLVVSYRVSDGPVDRFRKWHEISK
jgi:hypothetical protein